MTDRDVTDMDKGLPKKPETIAAAHGVATDPAYGAVAPPLFLSSTYEFAGYEQHAIERRPLALRLAEREVDVRLPNDAVDLVFDFGTKVIGLGLAEPRVRDAGKLLCFDLRDAEPIGDVAPRHALSAKHDGAKRPLDGAVGFDVGGGALDVALRLLTHRPPRS